MTAASPPARPGTRNALRVGNPFGGLIVYARARLCALALLLLAPAVAEAQFTTVVRPPRQETSDKLVERERARDSVATLQITSMQEWVDSVASAAAEAGDTIVTESAGILEADSVGFEPGAARESTVRYADGAAAPDTATPLPLLTLVGLLAAGLGGALLYRPRA